MIIIFVLFLSFFIFILFFFIFFVHQVGVREEVFSHRDIVFLRDTTVTTATTVMEIVVGQDNALVGCVGANRRVEPLVLLTTTVRATGVRGDPGVGDARESE